MIAGDRRVPPGDQGVPPAPEVYTAMPAPLSLDLRTRFIDAYKAGEGTLRGLAKRFSLSEATTDRLWSRFKKTGEIAARRTGGSKGTISADDDEVIRLLIFEEPDARIVDLVESFKQEMGRAVSGDAIKRAIKRMGITRKKKRSARRSGTKRTSSNGERSLRR